MSIYTPGSDTGLPISILASLAAPKDGWVGNEEAHREQINAVTTALLALIGVNAEPVKDVEHVLVANIFEYNWQRGINLSMHDLIAQVQRPPFAMLGSLPVDQVMSERVRSKLAMALNNIIAAPSFQSWMNGEPLDVQRLLYQPNGRPKVSIFYLAHLSEPERMFMMTLLLESMIGWMRTQSGTTSLRALLYIDEMYGYFPPYPKNPPTKTPLMTLLKQARAFGVGLVLATQNPGDLDYKGLTNAGTWFIGRLQSEQDRDRVRAGLADLTEAGLDMREVYDLIGRIPPRVFAMRNVHDPDGPLMLHSRWAMSYLRGPLTRQQVHTLMKDQRAAMLQRSPAQPTPAAGRTTMAPPPGFAPPPGVQQSFTTQSAPVQQNNPPPQVNQQSGIAGFSQVMPALATNITQYFFPANVTVQQALQAWSVQSRAQITSATGARLVYRPLLVAQAAVRYSDKKANVFTARTYAAHVPEVDRHGLIAWDQYTAEPIAVAALGSQPFDPGALFGEVSPGLADSKRMTEIRRDFIDMLYGTARLMLPFNSSLGVYANPDEIEDVFHARVAQAAREGRDAELDKTTQKYAAMMDKLEERKRRKHMDLRAEEQELADRRREETMVTGEALLSLFRGRTNYTVSRMSRSSRYRRQTGQDLSESRYAIDDLELQQESLEKEFESALSAISDKWANVVNDTADYPISPLKKDIFLELYGIGWQPGWIVNVGGQLILLPAFAG
jgi:hypothetical protein